VIIKLFGQHARKPPEIDYKNILQAPMGRHNLKLAANAVERVYLSPIFYLLFFIFNIPMSEFFLYYS